MSRKRFSQGQNPPLKLSITALYPHLAQEETVVDMNFISLSRPKCFFGLPIALTPNLLEEHSAFF
jgi:hypothetical protein